MQSKRITSSECSSWFCTVVAPPSFPVLEMKIWIYWSSSNSWIYFYLHVVLKKNWKIYWSEQSFSGLEPEDCFSQIHLRHTVNCNLNFFSIQLFEFFLVLIVSKFYYISLLNVKLKERIDFFFFFMSA
jgi:hypothetical protein